MTTIRDFLVGLLGGSELMWDVSLGVLIAFFVVWIVMFIFSLFR